MDPFSFTCPVMVRASCLGVGISSMAARGSSEEGILLFTFILTHLSDFVILNLIIGPARTFRTLQGL